VIGEMDGSDITVVIPSIPPRAHMLNNALTSVYRQTLAPKEIIVEMDPDHTGAAATRTRGLMKVTTEFVAFLDDDDELEPNHLELLAAKQTETDADLVYPWFTNVGGHDPLGAFGRPFDAFAITFANYIPITVLARTSMVVAAGGFSNAPPEMVADLNGATCEDWVCWLAMLELGAEFVHLPARTWKWHHHGRNTQGCGDRWI
jgi:hypothetical protein